MGVDVGVVQEARRSRDAQPGRARLDQEEVLLAVGDRRDDVAPRARPRRVTNHFSPFSTQSSPSRTAVVVSPERSEPAPGSVSAHASRYSPRRMGSTKRLDLLRRQRARAARAGRARRPRSRDRSSPCRPPPRARPGRASRGRAPPCSGGMLSIANPASRARSRSASTSAWSIEPRSAIRASSGYASCSMKRATRSFSSRISAGSSGTITGAPSLREDLSGCEGALEHCLLERARRAAVACLTHRKAVLCELCRHRFRRLPAQREHDGRRRGRSGSAPARRRCAA